MKPTKKRKQSTKISGKIVKKKKKKNQESISSLCNIVGMTSEASSFGTTTPTTIEQNDSFATTIGSTMIGSFQSTNNQNKTTANFSSSHGMDGMDDLDSCLALMDQPLNEDDTKTSVSTTANHTASTSQDATKEDESTTSENKDNILWKGLTSSNRNHNHIHHHQQQQIVGGDFHLPNIQIELTRHLHVGELSQFLLSKCPNLRMPCFERWLIDSKMEERVKRKTIQETNIRLQMQDETNGRRRQHDNKEMKWKQRLKRKRSNLKTSLDRHMTSSGMRTLNEYDSVIPTMADVDDDATQRLMDEINSSSTSNGENDEGKMNNYITSANNICRELCQKACDAARHVQNLNNHLGGPIHVNQYLLHGKKTMSASVGKIVLKMDEDVKNDDKDANNSTSHNAGFRNEDDTNEKKKSAKIYSLVYSRKNKKGKETKPFVVKINSQHYDKLREMFNLVHVNNEKLRVPSVNTLNVGSAYNTPATKVFHHLVFCILVRYAALSGGQQLLDLRGGGMQVSFYHGLQL